MHKAYSHRNNTHKQPLYLCMKIWVIINLTTRHYLCIYSCGSSFFILSCRIPGNINWLRKNASGEQNSLNSVMDIILTVIKGTQTQLRSPYHENLTNQGPRDTDKRTAKSALFSLHNGSLPGMRTQRLPLHSAHCASWEGVQHPAQISSLSYSWNFLQSLKRDRHWERSIYPTCLLHLPWWNKSVFAKSSFPTAYMRHLQV